MNEHLTFDDVLLVPKFSEVKSRKDVNPNTSLCGRKFLPVISANMDTITETAMAIAMHDNNAMGCLHRFWSIEKNCLAFLQSTKHTWVSVGLGQSELQRAEALLDVGAETILLDVAHGASQEVSNQVKELRRLLGSNFRLVVGNFATAKSIVQFENACGTAAVDAYKVGIGGGSACLTRVVTGCGIPTFGSVMDCVRANRAIIADGGIRNSGDVSKALAAGASAVMLGGMLAGTDETPGELIKTNNAYPGQDPFVYTEHKKYRGSASQESYEVQGKESSWRTPEGDSYLVRYKGSVKNVLQQIESGVRSAMSYVNATTLEEFKNNAEFIRVTPIGVKESGAHGKS